MKSYLDQLRESARRRNSRICFGLDPNVESMPEKHRKHGILGFVDFMGEIFAEMQSQKVYCGAVKPNFGYYGVHNQSRLGIYPGWDALGSILSLYEQHFPGDPTVGDWKLGDIAKSSKNYAQIYFNDWKVNAGTVSPWMGTDSIGPFAECGKDGNGTYLLNLTSNEGRKDFQELETVTNEEFKAMWAQVARKIAAWAKLYPGLGAVVGATSPEQLGTIAKLFAMAEVALLIPGVGAPGSGGQGGDAGTVSQALRDNGYPMELALINVSSALTHPWAAKKEEAPNDFAKVIVHNLNNYNEAVGYKAAA